jgi:RND family efflux transporter MFP subunit
VADAELLERYVCDRDEAAFELLLWRHGALVLNVCRRVLHREQDAEDAFQATFLAFVRKAKTIARRDAVAGWLYSVAYRVALEAKERTRRTAAQEKAGGKLLAVLPSSDPIWHDLRPILDEELNRLPERLRRPLVLCYLEGKSNEEAARQLGCRIGTIYSRLSRGREVLRRRLRRRGLTLSIAALTAAVTEHAAEATPATSLVQAAFRSALSFIGPSANSISPRVRAWAEGVLWTMFLTQLKMAALVLVLIGALIGGGVLSHALMAAPQAEEAKAEDPSRPPGEARPAASDPVPVQVVRPMPGGLQRSGTFHAFIHSAQQDQVISLVSGMVKELHVNIGDRVKKGQVLVVLDAPLLTKEVEQASAALDMAVAQVREAEAKVTIARAELESAQAALPVKGAEKTAAEAMLLYCEQQVKNAQQLIDQRVASTSALLEPRKNVEAARAQLAAAKAAIVSAQADVDVKKGRVVRAEGALAITRSGVRVAQVAVEKARLQESFTRITAAFDGVVTSRDVDLGSYVSSSERAGKQLLLTLQRMDQMLVMVRVPEREASLVGRGDPVDLTFGALPGFHVTGQRISRFSPVINRANGTLSVEIDVPNPDGRLLSGMAGQAMIQFQKRLADALVVPSSCLGQSKAHGMLGVYLIRDGKACWTPVEVSVNNGDKVEVVAGLKASDQVVTDPTNLKGDRVAVEVKSKP